MENPNSCCFVGRVEKILPIEGADRVEQAVISGWECVIQKGEFVAGNLVILAVTDAIIPLEMAEKLNIVNYLKHRKKTNQYTVRTTKLRGVYSTATIVGTVYDFVKVPSEGTDMMEAMGIFKYEEPVEILLDSKGNKVKYHKNPNFPIYYKFPNIKNVPNMFTEDDDVVVTRKIHGTNARYGIVKKAKLSLWDRIKKLCGYKWAGYDFVYGSHNVEKGSDSQGFYTSNVWAEIEKSYDIRKKLWNYLNYIEPDEIGEGIILYGEIYGPGIQKYYDYGMKQLSIVFVDMKVNNEYLTHLSYNVVSALVDLPFIRNLYEGKYNEEIIHSLYLNKFVEGKTPEEGVVVKHISGDRQKCAKFINPAYLEFQSKKEDSTDFH